MKRNILAALACACLMLGSLTAAADPWESKEAYYHTPFRSAEEIAADEGMQLAVSYQNGKVVWKLTGGTKEELNAAIQRENERIDDLWNQNPIARAAAARRRASQGGADWNITDCAWEEEIPHFQCQVTGITANQLKERLVRGQREDVSTHKHLWGRYTLTDEKQETRELEACFLCDCTREYKEK